MLRIINLAVRKLMLWDFRKISLRQSKALFVHNIRSPQGRYPNVKAEAGVLMEQMLFPGPFKILTLYSEIQPFISIYYHD